MKKHPRVSIGMPVFNEVRFISHSLEALASQDYPNFQLIISDNASTDGTSEIAQEFATHHKWVQYHRFEYNQGPAANFKYVLDQAEGQYFLWAAGHDLWSSNYISACVAQLEEHPHATLAFGSSSWIDEEGKPFERKSGWTDTRGMNPISRYFTVFWGNMHPILGLIRLVNLKDCPIISMVGADLNILTRLATQGDFVHATETHWQRREFRRELSYSEKLERYKSTDYALARGRLAHIFPLIQLPIALIKSVWSSSLPFTTRCAIITLLLPTMLVKYFTARH